MGTEVLSDDYQTSTFAHNAATTANTFYLINGLVLLALNTVDADEDNVFIRDADKVRAPKATSQAWTVGDKLYWDDTAKNWTTTSTNNTLSGYVAEPAANNDTEGKIVLKPYLA